MEKWAFSAEEDGFDYPDQADAFEWGTAPGGDKWLWDHEDSACDMVGNCLCFVLKGDSLRYIEEDVGTEWNGGLAESLGAGEYEGEGGDCDDEGEDNEGESDECSGEKGDSGDGVGYEDEEPGYADECDDLDEDNWEDAEENMEGDEEYAGNEDA